MSSSPTSAKASLKRLVPGPVWRGLKALARLPDYARQLLFRFPALYLQHLVSGRPTLMIYRQGGIGDLICIFPSVQTLRRLHPEARIVFVTEQRFVDLVRCCPFVDSVEVGFFLSKLLKKVLEAKMVFFPLLPDEGWPPGQRERIHLTEEFRRSFGLESLDETAARLEVDPADVAQIRERLGRDGIGEKPVIVLHTGPSWRVKEWPAEKWAALAAALLVTGRFALVQIGEDATATGEKRAAPRVPGAVNWIGQLSINETLALLSVARLFVGIDSGVLHLASTVGLPSVALFGPTDPDCFLPRSVQSLGITSSVPCLGCHHRLPVLHWREGCPNDIACMAEIAVDDVLAACLKLLPVPVVPVPEVRSD